MPVSKTIRAIREQLQVIQSAEETTGSRIFTAVKRIDALLTRLEAQIDSVLDEKNSD